RAISSFPAGIISISAGGLSGCGQATHLAPTVLTESRMPDANATASHPSPRQTTEDSTLLNILVDLIAKLLTRLGLLREDVDYHLVRASMVLIFLMFGYQKWFEYEAQVLIPYISNGPLISWLYPVFGVRGASWFLGVSEWLICVLL